MFGLNNAQLIGRLGADATISHLTNGGRVANISIATDESFLDKNSGDKVDRTEWHRIVTFQDGQSPICFSSLYINDLISLFVQPRRKVGQDLFGFRAESRHTSRREHRPIRRCGIAARLLGGPVGEEGHHLPFGRAGLSQDAGRRPSAARAPNSAVSRLLRHLSLNQLPSGEAL